jgi:hypothetical protein
MYPNSFRITGAHLSQRFMLTYIYLDDYLCHNCDSPSYLTTPTTLAKLWRVRLRSQKPN